MWLSRPAVSPISVPVEITCPSREFINYIINQLLNSEIKTLKFIRNPNSSPRQTHLLAKLISSLPTNSAQLLATNSAQLSSSLTTALMESSSMSSSGSLRKRGPTQCFCSEKPVLVVSWTPDNPRRRFYWCPNYWVS